MQLHDVHQGIHKRKKRKRIGRGTGSGQGKTAGKGHKGQKSRSGYARQTGFEGGQMTLIRRVPKRGFTNLFKTTYSVVNLSQLGDFDREVTPQSLAERGLVKSGALVKVLGDGEIGKPLTVVAHKFSRSARAKIEAAGGSCQEQAS
jgi:large subunit ribosomal protein L15